MVRLFGFRTYQFFSSFVQQWISPRRLLFLNWFIILIFKFPSFVLLSSGPNSLHIFVDHSAKHVVVSVDFCEIFVWSRSRPRGTWYKVRWSPDVPLPDPKDNSETVIASCSYEDEVGSLFAVVFLFKIVLINRFSLTQLFQIHNKSAAKKRIA